VRGFRRVVCLLSSVACLIFLSGCQGRPAASVVSDAAASTQPSSVGTTAVDDYAARDVTSADVAAARGVLVPQLTGAAAKALLQVRTRRAKVPAGWRDSGHLVRPYKVIEFSSLVPGRTDRNHAATVFVHTMVQETPDSPWRLYRTERQR
jgi:hypothetical protein